jgi:hypothetical protein
VYVFIVGRLQMDWHSTTREINTLGVMGFFCFIFHIKCPTCSISKTTAHLTNMHHA